MTGPDKPSAKCESKGEPVDDESRLEIASEWFWETDSAHRFTYVSSQSGIATGLTRSDIIGRKREDLAADRNDRQIASGPGKLGNSHDVLSCWTVSTYSPPAWVLVLSLPCSSVVPHPCNRR